MSTPIRVLLVQLPVPASPALNTPLAAAYLKAYAEAQGLAGRVVLEILPRVLADAGGDAALLAAIIARAPDLLALSLYTWNSERSLALAQRLKHHLPHLTVIVGGPEVQTDNPWVLEHPGVDVGVIGEGEQTFAEFLAWFALPHTGFPALPGLTFRQADGSLYVAPPRPPLADLMRVPSPYLTGQLDLSPDAVQLIELSRWCPYACSFCSYGRNLEQHLAGRMFNLERVLAEIAWGRARGVRRVHFVEANLNLLPIFTPLMDALATLNADQRQLFYAELRAEYLTAATVAALVAANVCVVEVGLQTTNPAALRAVNRTTNLFQWLAGVRHLSAAGIEVLLDVILGLPEDDADGVAATLALLEDEGFASYDAFMLQLLPGTTLRRMASHYGLQFQDRPPYYVLGTNHFSYRDLRRLRRELKQGAGLDPDQIEGMPPPRVDGFTPVPSPSSDHVPLHMDLLLAVDQLMAWRPQLAAWMQANPHTLFDIYLEVTGAAPEVAALHTWRDSLPYQPTYLDRVAVYTNPTPEPGHARAGLRLWLVLPWVCQVEPADYVGLAQVIWSYELAAGEELPLGAWRVAGGAGIRLLGAGPAEIAAARAWAAEHGRMIWV